MPFNTGAHLPTVTQASRRLSPSAALTSSASLLSPSTLDANRSAQKLFSGLHPSFRHLTTAAGFTDPKTLDPLSAPDTSDPGFPAPGGTPGTPGYTPDYSSLILHDPLLMQLQSNLSAQGVKSAAERKANIGQALTQFGEVPNFADTRAGFGLDPNSGLYQALMADVSPDIQQSAQDMTASGLSTTAGLARQHNTSIQSLLDSMAAHGTLQSGGTGVGLNQEDQNYSGNQFKARNDLLQYLAGVQHSFAQSDMDRQNQLSQGLQDATSRQIGLNPIIPADILKSLNIGA